MTPADVHHLCGALADNTIGTWDYWWPYAAVPSGSLSADAAASVDVLAWLDAHSDGATRLRIVRPADEAPVWAAAAGWLAHRGYQSTRLTAGGVVSLLATKVVS
jgi:hypothetical protein